MQQYIMKVEKDIIRRINAYADDNPLKNNITSATQQFNIYIVLELK